MTRLLFAVAALRLLMMSPEAGLGMDTASAAPVAAALA